VSTFPTIAITLGDPAGIGPEVVAKALTMPEVQALGTFIVIGNVPVMQRALDAIGSPLRATPVHGPSDDPGGTIVRVLDDEDGSLIDLSLGAVSADAGRASVKWVYHAARLAMAGEVDAIVTAPINKTSAALAGYTDVGHMEVFQSLTEAPQVATMLLTTGLRVVHLTTHRSLRLACDEVRRENVLAKINLTNDFFRQHGFAHPRIGVAALNPHGGESGLLGREEIDAIAPAVTDAQAAGVDAVGPVPADSVFTQAIDGAYDVVLAMYHDQGHIAVKVHGWEQSVTINLGLPFLRTSVDHGTAFDIAGRGIASPVGMVSAIRLAAGVAGGGGIGVL
jgi:4-hydroxythreonine-4-phosphate dehydrogenase